MTISIIIPVFNTKEYLSTCLDSILSQGFKDFEVLLVDDGSTDGSGAICDEYARQDSRITVFHKENGGVSSARNLGLDNAQGEWVYFVDSDDELLPNGLQTMVGCISDDVTVVIGGYEQIDKNGDCIQAVKDRVVHTLSKEDSMLMLFSNHTQYYSYMGYMWLWLFRRDLIQVNGLRFDTSIKIKEDTLFIVKYLCASNGVAKFNTAPVYKYKMREDSAMGNLGVKYSPDYRTSLDALIQMHSCIHQLPAIGKDLSKAAKFDVVNRVYMIRAQMMRFNAIDRGTVSSMKHQAIKEVGISYYLSFQFHRNRRRVKRIINRLIKLN